MTKFMLILIFLVFTSFLLKGLLSVKYFALTKKLESSNLISQFWSGNIFILCLAFFPFPIFLSGDSADQVLLNNLKRKIYFAVLVYWVSFTGMFIVGLFEAFPKAGQLILTSLRQLALLKLLGR